VIAAPPVAPAVGARSRLDRRLVGIDVARALAFGGMLLAHYVAPTRPGDAGWLQALDRIADGRAAPLFCVVLGMGAALLVRGGTGDATLLRRAAVLMAAGLALGPHAGAVLLILPHYAVLLALAPVLRRLPSPALLGVAGAAFTVPSTVVALVDRHRLRAAAFGDRYHDVTHPATIAAKVMWTGGYPVVGWLGFFAVGMWLVRLPLRDAAIRWWLVAGGLAVAALQPLATLGFEAAGRDPDRGFGAFLDGRAHSNRLAWYVLATGSAVAVVALALAIDGRRRRGWTRPLVALGQLSLTAYLAHLAVGQAWVWPWRDADHPSLAAQFAVAGLVFAGFALVATLWRVVLPRGPAEAVLRWTAGLGQRRALAGG
jgi:uncharacterized membrane protein YeiB